MDLFFWQIYDLYPHWAKENIFMKVKIRVVLDPTWSRPVLKEWFHVGVSSGLHFCQFAFLPLVHRHTPDKGQVDSKAPMFSWALQADPDPVGDRDPLRVGSSTLETFVVVVLGPQLSKDPPGLGTGHLSRQYCFWPWEQLAAFRSPPWTLVWKSSWSFSLSLFQALCVPKLKVPWQC